MKNRLFLGLLALMMIACASQTVQDDQGEKQSRTAPFQGETVSKTADEWRKDLSPEAFRVLREHGTERSFTGRFWDHKASGVYTCAACSLPLFDSETKFKSGTGWPSYYEPIDPSHVGETYDNSIGMSRTEVHCNRCGGHLGHVFPDGPKPTGLRYCINSVSLDFQERQP